MPPYRIRLLKPDGGLQAERIFEGRHDDEAIDHAGGLNHPHGIEVWLDHRAVARFPPWAPPSAYGSRTLRPG